MILSVQACASSKVCKVAWSWEFLPPVKKPTSPTWNCFVLVADFVIPLHVIVRGLVILQL